MVSCCIYLFFLGLCPSIVLSGTAHPNIFRITLSPVGTGVFLQDFLSAKKDNFKLHHFRAGYVELDTVPTIDGNYRVPTLFSPW